MLWECYQDPERATCCHRGTETEAGGWESRKILPGDQDQGRCLSGDGWTAAKSVKKTSTRGQNDDDASDAEQVSSCLLAAEQNKIRDRNAQVEKPTTDLDSTEQYWAEQNSCWSEEMYCRKWVKDQQSWEGIYV